MKTKIFGILLLLGLSAEIYAQTRTSTSTTRTSSRSTLRDGSSILRIEVGTHDRDQAIRIRNLEQAVRDLQYRIYDLEVNDSMNRTRAVDVHVCMLDNGKFIGKSTSLLEAKSVTIRRCNEGRGSFCAEMWMKCERTVEYVNY